jgi:hypothetical protein
MNQLTRTAAHIAAGWSPLLLALAAALPVNRRHISSEILLDFFIASNDFLGGST